MNEVKISVRNLIEFIKRSGDIDRRFYSNARAVAGIRAHQKIQKEYSENYRAEVFLRTSEVIEDINFIVEGRADGIDESEEITIDEIKSTTRDLEELEREENIMHWSQAKCYGYIYAKENGIDNINIMLTYYHLESEKTKKIVKSFSFGELRDFFISTLMEYLEFSKRIVEWREIRTKSIKDMKFPFKNYRKGQRELAVSVYNTISDSQKLFVEAPTGIGKSMSTIFPTIKAIGEDRLDKAFYLVARSTGKNAARDALDKLQNKKLRLKTEIVTAKEKICLNDEVKCNPKDCPYAKGHFDRVNDAIIDIFDNEDKFNRENIEKYAKLHLVCPFEFQLDLLDFADFIACDYNYIFDPTVYLKRFFENSLLKFALLIDEAHNLLDRGRDMYSADFSINDLYIIEEIVPKKRKSVHKHIKIAIEEFRKLNTSTHYTYNAYEKLNYQVEKIIFSMNNFLTEDKELDRYDEALDVYFKLFKYIKIYEYYNEDFVSIRQEDMVKIICLDISQIFKSILKIPIASIFFSATLNPINYYKNLLGGDETSYCYNIDSPFDASNLLVLRNTAISTVYKDREDSIGSIVNNLVAFSKGFGNYIFFFSSYSFMQRVYEEYKKYDRNALIQDSSMNEKDREKFLSSFTFSSNTRAFAVMGGVFSEGIDLIGKRLIGAAIITCGIPAISFERNILKNHFDKKYNKGYEYAYIYPGMIKVVQSAGRVIRTTEDRGKILLIDKRFSKIPYIYLLPNAWNIENYTNIIELQKIIDSFEKNLD